MSDTRHLVCPHCDAANRVPSARIGESPACGRCHRPLFTGHPVELKEGNFRHCLERHDIPVLVDFWAPWCGPCQSMAPQYAEAAAELEPDVRVAKLNTDDAQEIAAGLGIRSIPTLILFQGGREIARHSGALSRSDIVRWVRDDA